jgi:hypothetical protein
MATFNHASSTNNVNAVLWSLCTTLRWHTDRDVSGTSRGGLVQSVENLGVGVASGDPFTNLT